MNGLHGKAVNYGICAFGVLGSLLFSGLFGQGAPTLLFFWGILSVGLVLISGISLVGDLIFNILPDSTRLIYFLQLICNVLPMFIF
jgi:hypothetical protein